MSGVRGFTAIELLVALVISVLILSVAGHAYVGAVRAGQGVLRDTEGDQSAGIAWSVLAAELRSQPGTGSYVIGPGDSIRLRAFRGGGWPCPGDPPSLVRVIYRGDRNPNPQKDSVLALTDGGAWIALALTGVGSAQVCATVGRPVRQWTFGRAHPPLLYLRVFESGTYSVERAALRYRVGRGGRQPLTAERFDSTATLVAAGSSSAVGAALTLPIAEHPYRAAGSGARRVAWPRRRVP